MENARAPTPCFEPPLRPDLLSLPAELLHGIFALLALPDVLAARFTCTLLAAVGLDHFGHEVPLVFHREKFWAVRELSEHPVLARHMRSFYYDCGRLAPVSYEKWLSWRPRPSKRESSERARRVNAALAHDEWLFHRSHGIEYRERFANATEDDLIAAFEHFQRLCRSQRRIVAERYDAHCIRALFERCARIREVAVTVGKSDDQRRLHATTTAFRDLTTRPNCGGELNWKNEGTRQVRYVLEAVAAT